MWNDTIAGFIPRIRQISPAVSQPGLLARNSRMSAAAGGSPVDAHSGAMAV